MGDCRSFDSRSAATHSKTERRAQTAHFQLPRQPIIQVSTKVWYRALERTETEDYCRHDLRHTWANCRIQNGRSLFALQEMESQESSEMVRRYAYLPADHRAHYADRLESVHDLLSSSTRKAKWMNCKLVLSFRSQFFHRRWHFSIHANERSTTQR